MAYGSIEGDAIGLRARYITLGTDGAYLRSGGVSLSATTGSISGIRSVGERKEGQEEREEPRRAGLAREVGRERGRGGDKA